MKHEMKLEEKYFDKIKSGEKIYEIRLNDEKRKLISPNDIIVFYKEPLLTESVTTIVKELLHFESFDQMLQNLPLKEIGFQGENRAAVKAVYRTFYPEELEKKYGVVAIKLEREK